MIKMIVTFFGAGLAPKAPGTFGSLAALPFAFLVHLLGGFPLFFAVLLLVTFGGIWAIGQYLEQTGGKDPSEVVIDEVAGQMIALLPLSFGLWIMDAEGMSFLRAWPGWVVGFLLFRLFDIWKPWLVGWADRKGGALGVMLDDLIAGLFAAIIITFTAAIAHGWL